MEVLEGLRVGSLDPTEPAPVQTVVGRPHCLSTCSLTPSYSHFHIFTFAPYLQYLRFSVFGSVLHHVIVVNNRWSVWHGMCAIPMCPSVQDASDPFSTDPPRHPALIVNNPKPFNAETPPSLMMDNFR